VAHVINTKPATIVLRDERVVLIAPLVSTDQAEVARLVAEAADPRASFYARLVEQRADRAKGPARRGEFVARAAQTEALVGYAAYLGGEDGSGELAGVVDPRFAGVGLGTLLLRRAADDARRAGLKALRVELHPGSDATAAMLRDAGLTSRWDLDFPVTHVDLALGSSRSGWSTPDVMPIEGTAAQ
jgi:GNAT superfamily N-acetyltransferase